MKPRKNKRVAPTPIKGTIVVTWANDGRRLRAVYADGCSALVHPACDPDTECDCPARAALQGLMAA